MTIRLPKEPTDKDYEACVAAVLTGQGYFTECSMVLKEDPGAELLELDVVATPSNENYLHRTVLEAKSGKIRFFNELFKLYGWKEYLGLGSACLVHLKPGDPIKQPAIDRFTERTGVRAAHLDIATLDDPDTLLPACFAVDPELRAEVTKAAWWHRIAERLAAEAFVAYCKSAPDPETERARAYRSKIDAAFFARRPLARARALYGLYREYPKLPGDMVAFIAKCKKTETRTISSESSYEAKHLWVQYLMAVETRCRISIVKNAFDHILKEAEDEKPRSKWARLFEKAAMPINFRQGMKWLQDHEHRYRLPYLLQAFVEVFGGFLFDEEKDLALVSAVTGVPADDIVPALESLDQFFPFNSSWLHRGRGNIVMLKMLPAYVRGVGCFIREGHYSLKRYADLSSDNDWQLTSWHNALYSVLEPHLGSK